MDIDVDIGEIFKDKFEKQARRIYE